MLKPKENESTTSIADSIVKFLKSDSIEAWCRAEFHPWGKNDYSTRMTFPKKFLEESGLQISDYRAALMRVFLPEDREGLQGYANSDRSVGKIVLVLELPDKRGKN